jgi:hypothetical protein
MSRGRTAQNLRQYVSEAVPCAILTAQNKWPPKISDRHLNVNVNPDINARPPVGVRRTIALEVDDSDDGLPQSTGVGGEGYWYY